MLQLVPHIAQTHTAAELIYLEEQKLQLTASSQLGEGAYTGEVAPNIWQGT